jgi:hypothetical protein
VKKIFPYPVLVGDVGLRVVSTVVDGTPLALNLMNQTERVVALQELTRTKRGWNEIQLRLEAKVDERELTAGPWRTPVCVATVSNRRTRVGDAYLLRQVSPGRWTGEIELRQGEHTGRTEIGARVVATVDGVDGRLVGVAEEPWYADFDAREPTRQRSLTMRWIDFTDENNPHLHEFRHDPWLLEMDATEPVLCLNSSVEGLRGVLEKAATSEQKVARELLATQIASEAWSAMCNAALAACEGGGDAVEWPGGWQEDVLRRMLPDIHPGLSPDESLAEAVRTRVTGDGGGELQMRVMHAASTQAKKPRNVATAMKTLERMASTGETA